MNERELDCERIERLLSAATAQLEGDWLLVGGALVSIWLEPRRVTEDVDLIGLAGTAAERMALMELAESQGLPVEAVNSAADFFVRRIPGWRNEIRLLRSGASARIHRPTPTLFLLLKIGRLSEQDLGDCMLLRTYEAKRMAKGGHEDALDTQRVLDAIAALPPTGDQALATRRDTLRSALEAPAPEAGSARADG